MKRCQGLSPQLEQRVIILFCFKLGWKFQQIQQSLRQVYQQRTLSNASIYHWLREFRRGRTWLVDKPCAARCKTGRCRANVRAVEDMVAQDRRVSIAKMSLDSGVSVTSIHRILKLDLKLVKKCAIFVPHVLEQQHIDKRVRISSFMLRLTSNTPRILRNTVTMDEAWVYIYDPDLKVQSKEWLRAAEPCPQKACRNQFGAKVMLVAFFDAQGLIYYEYIQRPMTVNQQVFQGILRRFDAAHSRRHPRAFVNGHKFIHMDNAPAHNAGYTLTLLRILGWTRLPHPPYSPDLAPCDFWLFGRVKKHIRGTRFRSIQALKAAVEDEIGEIPSAEYKRAILHSWPQRWRKCLAEQGNYFEGRV